MSVKLFELLAMISSLSITPNHVLGRGNRLETQPGIESSERGDVIQNLPALKGGGFLRVGRRSDLEDIVI
jgi:hypothetical protein